MHAIGLMQIQLDEEQATVLDSILRHTLNELRIGSARADSHEYRNDLHHREHVVEALLAKIGPTSTT